MKRLQLLAIIIDLINRLKEKGSWCGETHIQKSVYFLQELTGVPLGFKYILYKHGPFSFDFRDELNAMWCDELIDYDRRFLHYGPSVRTTESANNLLSNFPITLGQYSRELSFIADHLGDKSVAELERMGTALYVSAKKENQENNSIDTLAEEIHNLKPHVSIEEAVEALHMVEHMKKEFNS